MNKKWRWLILVVAAWLLVIPLAAADDSCGRPGNMTRNCNFDGFVDRGGGNSTPDGWSLWVTMGSPAFDRDDHGSAPGAPAQRIWSDGGPWTAGLYQQVQVTPGKAYVARIDWAAPNAADIERKIGIDPFGGTDPLSPRVIWGSSEWAKTRMPNLQVSAFAQADILTVLVWTHHPISHGADQVFLDAVTLVEDPAMSAQATATASPSPTAPPPTRRPNTPAPTSIPPTESPTPAPSPTATETPRPSATATTTPTPTVTPTPSWTATPMPTVPTVTSYPTRTPLPTVVPVARLVATTETGSDMAVQSIGGRGNDPGAVFLYITLGALVAGLALAGVALWLWRRGRRSLDRV